MTKKFVISTDPLTADQEKALGEVLRPGGWWHWLPNFWLVVDHSEKLSVEIIRDAVRRINDEARCVILEVEPVTWAAMTKPDSKGRQMSDWIQSTWE